MSPDDIEDDAFADCFTEAEITALRRRLRIALDDDDTPPHGIPRP